MRPIQKLNYYPLIVIRMRWKDRWCLKRISLIVFQFHDGSFRELDQVSSANEFDGILMDLGISSFQLMEPEKGFSFRLDAPIDMRLDPRRGMSAAEFLETASEESLVRAIREYGEERRWRRVVQAIISARGTGALARTMSAAEVVSGAVGGRHARQRIHPATKTFQGIRYLRLMVNWKLWR